MVGVGAAVAGDLELADEHVYHTRTPEWAAGARRTGPARAAFRAERVSAKDPTCGYNTIDSARVKFMYLPNETRRVRRRSTMPSSARVVGIVRKHLPLQ